MNMALLHVVSKKREKVVHLLGWAGAPTVRTSSGWGALAEDDGDNGKEDDCYTALEFAASSDRGALLQVLKPDPARDDFELLYRAADTVAVLKYLIGIQPPTDWTRAIVHQLGRLDWTYGGRDAKACLDFIASQRGRLGAHP
jgi:hypothetical protein